MKERILKAAVDLFWRYGVKSVTMDDIAKELGISKKTIYQQFNDKDAIVKEVVERELDCEQTDIDRLEAEASDPIEEVMRTSDYIRASFATVSPVLLNDLKKYHPKAWALFQKHKHEHIIQGISGNLRRGMEAGLYRSDINVDVLARMRVEQIEMAFDPAIFPPQKFAIIEVHVQLIHHFLRGILTDQGFEVYNNYAEKSVLEANQK
ncbi:TetR/AcrR family transcriptional regulator [Persicitalea jodogahamensis]|uniref:TetR family transcriptional regulator n=1 Tax=Persicitalea jodogahamensis TaxID=402147 RepID=A0A8J3D4Q8_9BACT|nr:TetR/AcrR family transcriptional regulator [Persicitalea jodogahamensis]GHB82893.1 TetR family transcriptional regulator [Persicitalea jodogahamensis]